MEARPSGPFFPGVLAALPGAGLQDRKRCACFRHLASTAPSQVPQCTAPELRDNEIRDLLVAEVFSIPTQAPEGVTPKSWPQCPLETNQVLVPGMA